MPSKQVDSFSFLLAYFLHSSNTDLKCSQRIFQGPYGSTLETGKFTRLNKLYSVKFLGK